MKQVKTMLAIVMMSAFAVITSCNESTENKVDQFENADKDAIVVPNEEAEHNMKPVDVESNQNNDNVKVEGKEDNSEGAYNTFRMETERILLENEVKMVQLKAKILTQKADVRARYEKDLDALRTENDKLKTKLNTFTYRTNENWQDFKSTVVKDMDRIGKSISELTKAPE